MMHFSKLYRGITAFVGLAILITSCASPAAPTVSQPTATRVNAPAVTITPARPLPIPKAFQQAPSLKALVDQGSLPDTRLRLPVTPKVVKPVEKTGAYGGTWQMTIRPSVDTEQFIRTVGYEPLVRWNKDWSGIEPNLVERYEVDTSATHYRFYLRRGLRWSDGEPFTTEDIRFWYEEILLNKTLTPVIPYWLKTNNQVAKFEFVSDTEFAVQFFSANSLFLEHLATPEALMITAYPAHYAKKFHINYLTLMELQTLQTEGKYDTWQDMFVQKVGVNSLDTGNFVDPDRPRLSAWIMKTSYTPQSTSVVWERNPYYWKVDPQGNQLPYIDRVVFNVVNSVDEVVTLLDSGSIDMQTLNGVSTDAWASLESSLQKNKYRFYKLEEGYNNLMVVHFNLAHQNPVKQKYFQNKDFRIGLSLAINRKDIIDSMYRGNGTPWQAAPRPESPYYDEQLATQYTEFDLTKANEYLDKSGYKKDLAGKRLGGDGNPITFSVLVLDTEPDQIAMLNMLAKYWAMVGIDMKPEVVTLPVFLGMVRSNQHDAVVSRGGATLFQDMMLDPGNYLPQGNSSYWGMAWWNWYNQVAGFDTYKPPTDPYQQMQMFDQIRQVNDLTQQRGIMKFILTISRNSFWNIGVAMGPERFGVVKDKFYNVPASMPSASTYPDPAPTNPEQYAIEQ